MDHILSRIAFFDPDGQPVTLADLLRAALGIAVLWAALALGCMWAVL